MKYDIASLSKETGFDQRLIEKVLRISDVLQEISRVDFLSKRLSLYGGTALNFVHFPAIPRLSFDLDFNYRQISDCDWGEERNEIDIQIKRILSDQRYITFAIQSSYPLLRMDVKYRNHAGGNDSFKIEIGYLRRIPILKNDSPAEFYHLGTHETFRVLSPLKEELFANKVATMLSRKRMRDLFDVYQISTADFDQMVFKKCFIVECVMHRFKPKEMDAPKIVRDVSLERNLKEMVRGGIVPENMIADVRSFLNRLIDNIDEKEAGFIDECYEKKLFDLKKINDSCLHPLLSQHPSILWALKNTRVK
jgi:predicted nucleotidyltransferase component of viral defense system